jgi:glycosyltransferase involved in cell wall biosynthesis
VKIAYLFTTFPKVSETFLQREVRIMHEQGIELSLYTLWGGQRGWEGIPVYRLMHYETPKLLWRLPYHALRHPDILLEAMTLLTQREVASNLNFLETLRGFSFALLKAHHFKRNPPDLIHCTWATMPASAGWLLSRLTGVPFSMGAHAYDVFKSGGDRLLPIKCREARLIHTTTLSCREQLILRGARPEQVKLIRRGLDVFPQMKPLRKHRKPLRILAVGRLVPKKDYPRMLAILAHCHRHGLDFEARIVGGGPALEGLRGLRDASGLKPVVELPGAARFDEVTRHYAWADVMLFTGCVATDGDRDGLPNVIPEAFSWGLCVVTSDVAGTTEAVDNGRTGFVASTDNPSAWLSALLCYQQDDALCERIRQAARQWVQTHYDNRKNVRQLATFLKEAVNTSALQCPGASAVSTDSARF